MVLIIQELFGELNLELFELGGSQRPAKLLNMVLIKGKKEQLVLNLFSSW